MIDVDNLFNHYRQVAGDALAASNLTLAHALLAGRGEAPARPNQRQRP